MKKPSRNIFGAAPLGRYVEKQEGNMAKDPFELVLAIESEDITPLRQAELDVSRKRLLENGSRGDAIAFDPQPGCEVWVRSNVNDKDNGVKGVCTSRVFEADGGKFVWVDNIRKPVDFKLLQPYYPDDEE